MFTEEGNLATMGRRRLVFPFLFTILVVLLAGCEVGDIGDIATGGGTTEAGEGTTDGGGSDIFPAKILSWSSPTQYSDGSSLDPESDLDCFEIYINENGLFSNSDNEMAAVAASKQATGQVNTTFDLSNLSSFLSQGVTYYVSVRAVTPTGMKSDFSPGAAFSF